jgi:plastocyanin
MSRPARAAGLAAVTFALVTAAAGAASVPVTVEFQAFAPTTLDVLPGDAVTWMNTSGRRHTVTADAGQFDSGDLLDGGVFTQTFSTLGSYPYHCSVHPGMVGEVDVRRVTLEPLPPGLLPSGSSVDIGGRTADASTPIRVERDSGTGFRVVETAMPQADGSWKARVSAVATARYRVAAGADLSELRQLLVIDTRVLVQRTRSGISVTVVPAQPYARIALQLRLRERFGWWPVAVRTLDYLSQASFRVRASVQARVALLDRDGWTALALSPAVTVGRSSPPATPPSRRPGAHRMPGMAAGAR